ncbi:nuclear transport factor 2 family protein [Streptomyces sp. NPDC088747]|uniref:nuclear transport factor 2 family protein n=1 Tax=Streptomyces sp. NPDC088747 TaxID=3365886 RepID=UPI00381FA813
MSVTASARAAFEGFLDALHRSDVTAAAESLAEDATLESPILADALSGKAKAAGVLQTIIDTTDAFDVKEVLAGDTHFAAFFALRVGETELDGVNYAEVNDDDKIVSLKVLWRPLPAIVAVQNKIAPVLGAPALQLVPRD